MVQPVLIAVEQNGNTIWEYTDEPGGIEWIYDIEDLKNRNSSDR